MILDYLPTYTRAATDIQEQCNIQRSRLELVLVLVRWCVAHLDCHDQSVNVNDGNANESAIVPVRLVKETEARGSDSHLRRPDFAKTTMPVEDQW